MKVTVKGLLIFLSFILLSFFTTSSAFADIQFQQIPVRANISYPPGYTQQQGGYVARGNEDGTVFEIVGAVPHPVSGEFGYLEEAYVVDRTTGTTEFVGYKPDGTSFIDSDYHTYPTAISADGRYVLFSAFGDNSSQKYTGIFLFDRQTHTTQTIADNSADSSLILGCNPKMNPTAEYIFYCLVKPGTANTASIFNRTTNTQVQIPDASPDINVSDNGRYIIYAALSDNSLHIYDDQLGTTIQVNTNGALIDSPAISNDGLHITYDTSDPSTFLSHVTYRNLISGQVTEKSVGTHNALLSADGSTLVMHGASGGIIYSNPPDSAGVAVTNGQYDDPYSINSKGTIFTFNQGNWNTDYVVFATLPNTPPTVNPLSNTTVNEGDTFTQNGSFTDPDSTSWTATVDYGDGYGAQPLSLNSDNTFNLSHVYHDNGTYTVDVAITDNQGLTGTQIAAVTVNNVVPILSTITAPTSGVAKGTSITASASFTDPGVLDTHTASWDWGDGTTTTGTVTESSGSGTVSDTHTYNATGEYPVTLTLTDKDGGVATKTFNFVVVYDSSPGAGWVSGSKEYASPNGGTASFGFQAKYQNGAMVPSGKNVTLLDPAGNINFSSTGYEWLVVNGTKAVFKADGTLNGTSGYTILVSTIDTGHGQGGLVRFQIKDAGGNVVYDTQPGAVDTADPTTSVTKGQITVH